MEETIAKIQMALVDPNAPWYGSNLIVWVGDLLANHEQLQAELAAAKAKNGDYRKAINLFLQLNAPITSQQKSSWSLLEKVFKKGE